MTTAAELERSVYTIVRGTDWYRSWVLTAGDVSTWNESTLVAQIRAGADTGDPLVATSVDAEGVTANLSTADTNLAAATPVLALKILRAATIGELFVPGDWYTLGVVCEVDGVLEEVKRHRIWIAPGLVAG